MIVVVALFVGLLAAVAYACAFLVECAVALVVAIARAIKGDE